MGFSWHDFEMKVYHRVSYQFIILHKSLLPT